MMIFSDRASLRKWYADRMRVIVAAKGFGFDKWKIPYLHLMTPIEKEVWNEIITCGLVMYPEFPVGKYFVDFGNPRTRVAIECDGAAFHTDRNADQVREQHLRVRHGWTIYRMPGSHILAEPASPPDDMCEHELYWNLECCRYCQWYHSDAMEAVIQRIKDTHGNY